MPEHLSEKFGDTHLSQVSANHPGWHLYTAFGFPALPDSLAGAGKSLLKLFRGKAIVSFGSSDPTMRVVMSGLVLGLSTCVDERFVY